MTYNYEEAMKNDVREWIDDNVELTEWTDDAHGLKEHLHDELWAEDSITGNGCWGYGDDDKVKQYVLDNIDLCKEALKEFCTPSDTICEKFFEEEWTYFDLTIRCYLLYGIIDTVVDELTLDSE